MPPIGPFFHDQTRTGAFATEATNTFRDEPNTQAVSEAVVEEAERIAAQARNDASREGVMMDLGRNVADPRDRQARGSKPGQGQNPGQGQDQGSPRVDLPRVPEPADAAAIRRIPAGEVSKSAEKFGHIARGYISIKEEGFLDEMQAVDQSMTLSRKDANSYPKTFPPADGPEFKDAMARNQETIARIEYTVNEALVPITGVSKLRDHEPSRRWQAHYDLIRGRLLAMKIRCAEYQTACAKMKKDPLKFKDAKSNAWRLVPTEEILSGDKVAKVAKDTKALLERVVNDHPNTPWALLARRELKDPFGFKWVETYVPPPPPQKEGNAAEAKKKKAAPKQEMAKEPEIKL